MRCPASRNQRSVVAAQKVYVLTMSIHRRSMAMNMDVHFEYHGNTFVCDKGKARSNLHNHAVAFVEASAAFFDPLFVLLSSSRYLSITLLNSCLLCASPIPSSSFLFFFFFFFFLFFF